MAAVEPVYPNPKYLEARLMQRNRTTHQNYLCKLLSVSNIKGPADLSTSQPSPTLSFANFQYLVVFAIFFCAPQPQPTAIRWHIDSSVDIINFFSSRFPHRKMKSKKWLLVSDESLTLSPAYTCKTSQILRGNEEERGKDRVKKRRLKFTPLQIRSPLISMGSLLSFILLCYAHYAAKFMEHMFFHFWEIKFSWMRWETVSQPKIVSIVQIETSGNPINQRVKWGKKIEGKSQQPASHAHANKNIKFNCIKCHLCW